MKRLILLGFLIMPLFLASCGLKQDTDNSATGLDEYKISNTADEVTEGNFIYRIATEKGEYGKSDTVNIYAELEYIGNKEEVVIYHAASPFYFPMIEKTRDYEIDYPMNEPLVSTTLIKGQSLRHEYSNSGGYSSQDGEDYAKFMRSFLEDGFPSGYYVVNGFAKFYIEDDEETKKDFTIRGQIDFKVQ